MMFGCGQVFAPIIFTNPEGHLIRKHRKFSAIFWTSTKKNYSVVDCSSSEKFMFIRKKQKKKIYFWGTKIFLNSRNCFRFEGTSNNDAMKKKQMEKHGAGRISVTKWGVEWFQKWATVDLQAISSAYFWITQ